MKIKITLLSILCAVLFTYCSSKEEPLTVKEQHQQLLTSKSWKLQRLTIDGIEEKSLYAGMTLQFTDTGFTAENGMPIWPASSSWTFTDESGDLITRDGNVQLSIIEITETKLVILLQWSKSTYASGRNGSIHGEHIFTFAKQ